VEHGVTSLRQKVGLGLRKLGERLLAGGAQQVWLDVGAHQGETTFAAARRNPQLTVYAFEPQLEVARAVMGRLPNFIVLPLAIAETDGAVTFHVNKLAAASSILPLDPEAKAQWIGGEQLEEMTAVTVPAMRLDTFLNRMGIARVDYLKVDAQGADLAVLRSAGARLRDIQRIQEEVQVTSRQLYRGAGTRSEVEAFLQAAGFQLVTAQTQNHAQEQNLVFAADAGAA
jgi:FkbM family methyltransferase